jgi:hypothetical protein
MAMDKYYIYIHAFWGGFKDKTDANHVGFFEKIFQQTKFKNFELTNNIDTANVLFESVFEKSLTAIKKWNYTIYYSGEAIEAYKNNTSKYDIVLDSDNNITEPNQHNIVDVPLCIYYTNNNNFFETLISRPYINKVPSEFCCFVVSNPNSHVRNKMFKMLNNYKNVHSYGKFANNMNNGIKYKYWTNEYLNFIGKYKFIICFENSKKGTYITEKIVNPFLARIVPIYWGTHHVKNVFNPESMLFLEDESDESYSKLINRIIELDNNDEKYLEVINKPSLNSFNLEYWNNNYTIENIAKKIDNIIL